MEKEPNFFRNFANTFVSSLRACEGVVLDFFNKIQILYENFGELCTAESCPVMNAGSKYEYKWADGVKVKKPISCTAPEYIDNLMSWVQDKLEDTTLFPQEPNVPFPKIFRATVKDIFRRLFRVYAHLYLSHAHHIEQENFTAHINTCGRHFVFFIQEFDLVEKKQLEPLASIISEWDAKYPPETEQ